VLRRENELRLSPETLAEFSRCGKGDGRVGVIEALQRRVATEFCLQEHVGLAAMRCADQLLPDDPEVTEISLYRKYNRCRDGDLHIGDRLPDAALHLTNGEPTTVLALLKEHTPLVVFASSYT